MKDIREKVLEIVDIAKSCPENLQTICFETLLKHYLAGFATEPVKSKKEEQGKPTEDGAQAKKPDSEKQPPKQEDIKDADLHLKVKKLMQKEGVTLDQLNNLFYREEDLILPLFTDLKTNRMAESQIRITLLQCLIKAIATGEFETDVETIRTECGQRKCYDSPNFSANFRNNNTLFDFTKFDRSTKTVRLSDVGRKELATLIKELQ